MASQWLGFGMSVRSRLKTLAEQMLVRSGVTRIARRTTRGRAVILAYHNVVPRGAVPRGERALHLAQDVFAAQLDHVQDHFDVLSLDDLLATPGAPDARPRAAITFDDAYRGAIGAGVAELQRRRLPATIFVAPAFVGGGTFWWDALVTAGELPSAERTYAMDVARGDDTAIRRWATENGHPLQAVPEHATVASEPELAAVALLPGIVLGSHSWSHMNLTRLSPAELQAELRRPLEWLEQRFPTSMTRVLAYPYGRTISTVERAVAETGYAGALLVTGGWHSPASVTDRYRLPRLNIPAGLSAGGFALRAAGLFCR